MRRSNLRFGAGEQWTPLVQNLFSSESAPASSISGLQTQHLGLRSICTPIASRTSLVVVRVRVGVSLLKDFKNIDLRSKLYANSNPEPRQEKTHGHRERRFGRRTHVTGVISASSKMQISISILNVKKQPLYFRPFGGLRCRPSHFSTQLFRFFNLYVGFRTLSLKIKRTAALLIH